MPNPDRIGEFSKFYYRIADTDLTQPDPAILALGDYVQLCLQSFDVEQSFEEHTFNDQCSADVETVAPGRKTVSLSFELYQLRHQLADIRPFYDAVDSRTLICMLALTSEIDDPETFGFVGNMIYTNSGVNSPQSGPINESYTLRPAARSQSQPPYRRIYGAGVPV